MDFDTKDLTAIKGFAFVRTCEACPEQYDVFHQGKIVCYVRLRWGNLTAEVPDVGGKLVYQFALDREGMQGIFRTEEERTYHLEAIAKILKLHVP